ncbi:MAG: hypothetical protein AMXMBFR84_20640 [Candidatus Hydrogenedentota bacterium]
MKKQFHGLRIIPVVLVCLTAALLTGCPLAPKVTVVYVNANTAATKFAQDGLTWPTAFAEIQAGIDAAAAAGGGEVWVAKGTYAESRSSDPDGSLVMKPGVHVYGGFIGLELVRHTEGCDYKETIIDGSNGRAGLVTPPVAPNAYHVIKGADNATLDGFYITGGDGTAAAGTSNMGAGMYNDSVSPTINNCAFYSNFAGFGGGMYNLNANPVITKCRFENNVGLAIAGAIYNDASAPDISRSLFINNVGITMGGAMSNLNGSAPVVTSCQFLLNQAAALGGAMFNGTSTVTLTNCVFAYGIAYSAAGGVYNAASSVDILNCVFYANYVAGTGGAIVDDGTDTRIVNTIFRSNEATASDVDITGVVDITYSCTQSGIPGIGNIVANPLFVDELDGNFQLRPGSPCIDTGTPVGTPTVDIRDHPRPQGANVDMGVFE